MTSHLSKGQEISKANFVETPLPKKQTIFFEGFQGNPFSALASKMGQIKKDTHNIMYILIGEYLTPNIFESGSMPTP